MSMPLDDVAAPQPVLRCSICNKPFDKQTSLKRHGYYCRASKGAAKPSQTRSCLRCAKSKIRCDGRQKGCSRCSTKGFDCEYPSRTRIDSATRHAHRDRLDHSTSQILAGSPIVGHSQAVDQSPGHDLHDDAHNADLPDWNEEELNFLDLADFTNLLPSPVASKEQILFPTWEAPWNVDTETTTSLQPLDGIPWSQTSLQSPRETSALTILTEPSTYMVRTFTPRSRTQPGSQRLAQLLAHTLKSYPRMLLQNHHSLPPFIHPRLLLPAGGEGASDGGNLDMEPLHNCLNLLELLRQARYPGGRQLFWRNVKMECERFCAERFQMNSWQVLAALQALLIYILLRLDEGESAQNDFDGLMIATVIVLSERSMYIDMSCRLSHSSPETNDAAETRWGTWILHESRQRLAIIYRVLNLLIYFEPAALCTLQTSLTLAPLPAQKQLWEASGPASWMVQVKDASYQSGVSNATFAMAKNGELVRLLDGQNYCGGGPLLYESVEASAQADWAANWEEWCSGTDGLGSLVVLAAALVA